MDTVAEYDDHVIELVDKRLRARINPFDRVFNEYVITIETDILKQGDWDVEMSFTTDPSAKQNFTQYMRLLRLVEDYLANQLLETS